MNKVDISIFLKKCCRLLQPVTPTLGEYNASWWNENYGKRIIGAQEEYIKQFSKGIIECLNMEEINTFINNFKVMQWPLDRDNPDFWGSPFGIKILSEWSSIWTKFFAALSDL